MYTCPECKGEKFLLTAFPPRKLKSGEHRSGQVQITCNTCKGTGTVDYVFPQEWIGKGKLLKDSRLINRITLREAAKMTGIPATVLSRMERGLAKPIHPFHVEEKG